MGTTLTGTTPQDTYDSLIKVTDNGPLSGSLKKLTDGLGNDSALSLSTGAASIAGTLAVTGTSTFNSGQNVIYASFDNDAALFQRVGTYGNVLRLGRSGVSNTTTIDYPADATFAVSTAGSERLRISSAGNVGIGTAAPSNLLSVGGTSVYNLPASTAQIGTSDAQKYQLLLTSTSFNADGNWIGLGMGYNQDYMKLAMIARASDGAARGTINFCINNSATSTNASLADTRVSITSSGLTFNGDTAAANALDDYEEGTWTPVYAGGLTGVTYNATSGKYTKIGNVVHWSARVQASAATATAAAVVVGGFPFTNSATVETAGSIGFFSIYTTDQVYLYNEPATTSIAQFYKKDGTPLVGTDLTLVTGTIHMSGAYFV